ncbi:MAG: nucleoside-diphosphate kinase [Clostridia bacterium]|nr:nucleoside-diphosphate kinase [Clostridia bacterium]MBR5753610.1 nucleoside-diphosphate kinase [Clostridia bacterium]
MERTYIMLKPDCVQRGLIGEVVSRIEHKGYKIVEMKMMTLSEKVLREHYAHVADMGFFPELLDYMMSGPVVAMIVEGEGVIAGMRRVMGPTNNFDAAPGTIRGDFACSTSFNIIHGSDSPETAEIEIKRFFG